MGKSLTATLIGVLVQQGLLSLDQPAPVREWQGKDDPRAAITISDRPAPDERRTTVLGTRRPARGLATRCTGSPVHLLQRRRRLPVRRQQRRRVRPRNKGRYLNCDPLTLGYIVKRTVTEILGEDYPTWPQKALFDQVGIRHQVLETAVE